jgi:hypothetical protein
MAAAYEPPVSDDRGPLVIRPSWRSLRLRAFGPAVVLIVFLLVDSAIRGPIGDPNYIAAMVLVYGMVVACYALYLTAYMMGTTIVVTADTILLTHWFRATSKVARGDIARTVRCGVAGRAGRGNARQAVFALSPSGRCVMSLYVDRWNPDDLDRIWRLLGVTPEGSWDDIVWDVDLDKKFPGAF